MYSKHKDDLPEKTVERIKKCYADNLGLALECHIDKHVDGVYSAYLFDKEGGWNTAGKGTTEAYCMASAYGESMEHLCNHFAFDISRISPTAREYGGFFRYVDEQQFPLRTVASNCPSVWKDMTTGYLLFGEKDASENAIVDVWQRLLGSDTTPFIPYYCVNSDQTIMLPDAIISKMCGSNGGGSGNTPEEAIGHALDEIVERYAKYRIIYENLTPPIIPMEYIKTRCRELYELIHNIECSGSLKIIVKDASLGKGYCVLCILVVDETSQRYLVNFGAHPCFEIALERCLTELFQDHKCASNLLDRNDMVKWCNVPEKTVKGMKNWVSLLRDDIGYLPDSFFLNAESWSFKPWPEYNEYSNRFGVIFQIELLKQYGFELYIRNNSFLGFPVYRVYIPEMSISHLNFDEDLVTESILASKFRDILMNGASYEEKKALSKAGFHDNSFLLGMSLQGWPEKDISLLKAAIACDMGDYANALSALHDCDCWTSRLLHMYLDLNTRCYTKKDIRDIILLFFGNTVESDLMKIQNGDAFTFVTKYLKEKGLIKHANDSSIKALHARDLLHIQTKKAIRKWKIDQNETKQVL